MKEEKMYPILEEFLYEKGFKIPEKKRLTIKKESMKEDLGQKSEF